MGKHEERIFKLNDQIAAVRREEEVAFDEWTMLRHLDDDAQRDAAVSEHALDRADARQTKADVARMRRTCWRQNITLRTDFGSTNPAPRIVEELRSRRA